MKRWAIISTLCLGFILTGCTRRSERIQQHQEEIAQKRIQRNSFILSAGTEEVLTDIFDDQFSSVYIRVADFSQGNFEASLAEIMTKKKSWQKQFPDRKIRTMSIITYTTFDRSKPVGLLIDYEKHE